MTLYGFSDNLTSPVPVCMPATAHPNVGFLSRDFLE